MATNSTKTTNDGNGDSPVAQGGSTPYINAQTAHAEFTASNNWMRPYFQPIDEYERIARNRPSDRIPSELPKVTDGTLAAILQEDPKRVIQQLATGLVESKNNDAYAKIADIVHRQKLLPMYRHMGTALQKHWNMLSKARTWGRSASYTFFTSTNGQLHTDFIIPYVKDIISERGKVYAPDSHVIFMRSWYQKTDIQAIIAREEARAKKNKGYKSEWNLGLLRKLIEAGPSDKPADLQTPAEKEKGGAASAYEIIHAFQDGVGAEFYSFSPRFEDGVALRTKINPDPRGKMPIDFEYCNIDLSNPLGRGSVEASGGVQNLIDQQMQMFQFISTIMMAPPLQVWGSDVKINTLKFRPNAVWRMGANGNNKVEPYAVNNQALGNFAGNYGLLKSQIMNLNNSQDHSVSSSDAPGQSKTQAGVQASESRLGVSDNYMRKQHEAWFEAQAETSINLYFAEMTGPEKIKLDTDDLKELSKHEECAAYIDLKTGILTVPHDKISKVSFTFNVNPSSSEIKEDLDNADKLSQALALVQKSQDPKVRAAEAKITKLLLDEIGAEGTDDLFPEDEVDEQGNPIQNPANDPNAIMQQLMPQVQQMVQEMIQQSQKQQQKEDPTLSLIKAIGLKYDQLPDEARKIVLQHTGLGDGGTDPIAHKRDLETLDAMNRADEHERGPELQREQQQSQIAAKASQVPAGAEAPQEAQQDPQMAQELAGLEPEEQQLVEGLIHAQYSDQDIEQAIVMLRQGQSVQDVMQILRSKYATAR